MKITDVAVLCRAAAAAAVLACVTWLWCLPGPDLFKLSGAIAVPGDGGWDYLTADADQNRLYVSHGNKVDVVDLSRQQPAGEIANTNGVHGIAIAGRLHRGFISCGRDNAVTLFDTGSLKALGRVQTGQNPDGIVYDEPSNRVFAFNGRDASATVIDPEGQKAVGTIPLGGKPEFPVSDGKGHVFVNIEDKSEIVVLDAATMKVRKRWPLAPCEEPSGLAMDRDNHRLFAVCSNKMMAIVDSEAGKVVATPAIGDHPDAAAFDPQLKMAFSSNGDGTLTVIKEQSGDRYQVAQTVQTKRGARTMALNGQTHTIYLSSADYGPAPAASAANPRPRPTPVSGSFKVLVVSRTGSE